MRSEVRRFDRREARPLSVLYKYNVHVRDQASSRLRHKFKRGAKQSVGAHITKEQLLDVNFVVNSQKRGLAMPCLLPNSSEYWRGRAHDLFAMNRQLGRPHLFATLSFSENNCKVLLSVLRKLHLQHGEMDRHSAANIDSSMPLPAVVSDSALQAIDELLQSEDDGEGVMSSEEKLRLIREDPVVCAMMFREIVLQLKKNLRKKNGPMGRYHVKDWFIRIEFQQRGAPHAHCLLWLNDGPTAPLDDIEGTIRFVDELLTCDSTRPFAARNSHKHTNTCFRNKHVQRRFRTKQLSPTEAHRYCRFGAPFWPTPRSRILYPLLFSEEERRSEDRDDRTWDQYIEHLRQMRLRLKDVLSSPACPGTLQDVWREAGCPDDYTYELAIRTDLKHVKMLYKREVCDRWTNPFLPWVLDAFGFNTDAQIVLDVYSLVRYCVSYVTKAEQNHSQLHNEITNLRREQGFDDRTLMRMLASRCLRAKETSAQEASWVLLNFPLCEMSRKCTFIDTSPPDDRNHCPKAKKNLEALPAGSTDLWYPDIFDVYSRRREDLSNVTLAEFAAVYHQCQNKDNKARRRDRIIRYRRYNEHSDDWDERENFHRAMCTLHVPWREESEDILSAVNEGSSFADLYAQHEESITIKRQRFEAMLGIEQDMEDELQDIVAEEEAEANEAAENARHQLAGDGKFVFDDAEFMDRGAQDIDIDLPEPRMQQPNSDPQARVRRRGVWDRETYLKNIRRLNKKQREVVLAVYDGVRLQSDPLLLYVDGAAGTGKSVVAQCCANAFDTFAGPSNSSDARVIVCAPTGKAACVIGGMTIHHSHSLSYNQEAGATERMHDGSSAIMCPLQGQRLANIQILFMNVEAQLIDEISMVSDRNFLAVDQRCKEAKGKEDDFGGLWTIVFGDYRQLTPVGGAPVYACSTEEITGSAALWQKFQYVELTENMRQGEDKQYADMLAVIGDAESSLCDEDCALTESRSSLKIIYSFRVTSPACTTEIKTKRSTTCACC
ncbi:hypothetical protein ONE63_010369 [Megalurothrips usitatus]|uniref:ATP-dependent DNA helicase n=1 Tax=Megalurothrips usitatus TaxID=439358 RepID=A0AAV7XLU4_9NEOP|nr:hypothetical protein ONE63_010369 [Megalurothrips usitatus]